MKFSLSLVPLFAATSLSFPAKSGESGSSVSSLLDRLDHRGAIISLIPKTSPLDLIAIPGINLLQTAQSKNAAHAAFSTNWCGAVLTSPPSGHTFAHVSGQFTVPKVNKGPANAKFWAASAWVGIDGDTYPNAILQTGVDFYMDENGKAHYNGWYEWYPAAADDFTLVINEGDEILLSVQAISPNTGSATIHNLSTGKSVSQILSSAIRVAGQNAEWIIEDFMSGGQHVPLANWSAVQFHQVAALTNRGQPVDLSEVTAIDMVDHEFNALSNTQITGHLSLDINYVSPI